MIRGILAWGRQRDMTQIRKCTINLPFIQNVCFIVVSWPIAALNKYITYLDLAFRRRAGVCLEGQICLLFPRVCKEQIMQISLLPDSPAADYIEKKIGANWSVRDNTTLGQFGSFLIFSKRAALQF